MKINYNLTYDVVASTLIALTVFTLVVAPTLGVVMSTDRYYNQELPNAK